MRLSDAGVMAQHPDCVSDDTYVRFLVRFATESEHTWRRNYLATNPTMTPELIDTACALSEK